MSIETDMASIKQLLTEAGPLDVEDIRTRLCFASAARAKAALFLLKEEREVEQAQGPGTYYRVKGDTRPLPVTSIHTHYGRRYRSKKAGGKP